MTSRFEARDPGFRARVRASFSQQGLMATIGAELASVEPGMVEIAVPFAGKLTQQDGFLHAGVVIAAVDSACGYAALTLMERGRRARGDDPRDDDRDRAAMTTVSPAPERAVADRLLDLPPRQQRLANGEQP